MAEIVVTVSQTIEVPEGSRLVAVPTGDVLKILLPCGTIIRPWISFEATPLNSGDPQDVDYEDLSELDVDTGSDTNVILEADLPTISHEDADDARSLLED